MMDDALAILTSPGVFAELVAYYQAKNQRCIVDDHQVWVENLGSFYTRPGDSAQDLGAQGTICLDDDLARLRWFAAQDGRALWYNPAGQVAPDFVPAHDGEIVSLDALLEIPSLLAKPTLNRCKAWMDAWGLPDNIHRHVELVGRLAYGLGVLLRGQGQPVDPILAHRGGLLHDLDKLHTLNGDQRHGAAAASFLRTQGHPDLAEIVRGHIPQTALEGPLEQQTWEVCLVFFCDKLVEQDQIVPFDLRVAALMARYPGFREIMERAEPAVWALNQQICSILSIPSHQNLIYMLQEL